ncbi:MAG TPA: hypothetical protein VMD59_24015, partial [Acidimicrobiales bacterium]|nr:hypothetical protein [Acidimicrobiales bacterium]
MPRLELPPLPDDVPEVPPLLPPDVPPLPLEEPPLPEVLDVAELLDAIVVEVVEVPAPDPAATVVVEPPYWAAGTSSESSLA